MLSGMIQNLQGLQGLQANQVKMDEFQTQKMNRSKATELLRSYQETQDPAKLNEAILLDGELANNVLAGIGIQDKARMQRAADDYIALTGSLGNKDQFNQLAAQRLDNILAAGGNPSDTLAVVKAYNEQGPEAAKAMLQPVGAALVNKGVLRPELFATKEAKQAPYQQGQGEMSGFVFDPNTGKFTIDEAARQAYTNAKTKQESGDKLGLKDMVTLNKEISAITKDATMIHRTAQDIDKLKNIGGGPASISIVYKFMKSLDPTSVVREGEFATAENAAGVPDTVANIYNKLINGERLPQSVIDDFSLTAKELANTAVDSAETEVNDYLNTFGDNFDKDFAGRLKDRVPKRFEVKPKEIKIGKYGVSEVGK
jgi:hypothetical protein